MTEGLPHHRRSRVLIADDTESVRSLFERLLSSDGHDVEGHFVVHREVIVLVDELAADVRQRRAAHDD